MKTEHWGFKMATNYIYKYVRNNEIIYIGKTKNLQQRHRQHLQEDKFLNNDKLYYFICETSNIMDLYETALINKYHPILNIADNYTTLNIEITEPDWLLYNNLIVIPNQQVKGNKETIFEPIEYKNIFNASKKEILNRTNIELPLLHTSEWKLLLSMKLKKEPITTREYLKLIQAIPSGDAYKNVRKIASSLASKNLCYIIEDNLFDITELGKSYVPYDEAEILKMLAFRSKYAFWLYSAIKNKFTVSVFQIKYLTGYTDIRDIGKHIIKPAIEQYNTLFSNEKRTFQKNKKGKCIESISFVEV